MRPIAFAIFIPTLLMAGDKPDTGMPKPTPHHEAMKAMEGTWDAEVLMAAAPGQPEQTSKGVETVKLVSNGLWAEIDFKGDFGGMPFEGHGLFGYDTQAKRHVGTWVDCMNTSMSVSSGRCDGQCKRVVSYFKAMGMSGKMTDYKEVNEVQDAGHRTMEMSSKMNGKFVKMMTIKYTKRAA